MIKYILNFIVLKQYTKHGKKLMQRPKRISLNLIFLYVIINKYQKWNLVNMH